MTLHSKADRQFEALGDPTRRAIFALLSRAPAAVGDVARTFPVSRPAVSQHLRVLKEAGLIALRRDGTRNVYRADPAGIASLVAAIEQFRRDALIALEAEREPVA